MDAGLRKLRLRQLDTKLQGYAAMSQLDRPAQGWIRSIRMALGMSTSQLAARLGITRQAVSDLEQREASGTVTLEALKTAAAALDCDVVYAVVPRKTLTTMVQDQARRRAAYTLGRVAHTMSLEAQQVAFDEQDRQIEDAAAELVRTLPRSLWDPFPGER